MADGQDALDARRAILRVGSGTLTPGVFVAVVALGVSLAGAIHHTRTLESVEHTKVLSTTERTRWTPARTQGPVTLSIGTLPVPARGVLRVSVCALATPSALALVVSAAHTSPVTLKLTADDARGDHCLAAEWHARTQTLATAQLRSSQGGPVLRSADVRTGLPLTVQSAWPMVLLLLALGWLVFASPNTPRWPPPAPETPALDPWRPAVLVPPWVALLALVAINLVLPLCMAIAGPSAHALLYGLVLQHGLLAGTAAYFLGGFAAVNPRDALGLGPVSARTLGLALFTALALVVVAGLTSLGIHNAGDTPLGQAIESSPLRYAIVFGALGAPLAEELFFRGALVSALGRRSVYLGVWSSALVFAGMHVLQLQGALLGLLPIALLGVTNGYLRVHTRGLTAPWLVHTVYNAALAAPVFFGT